METHFDSDKSLFLLKISCSGFLSFHSEVTDKYSFHYFFLIFITAGFCVCMLAEFVYFLTLHRLLSNSFPFIFRELSAYDVYMMFAVQPVSWCVLFSCPCKHPCCLLTFPPFYHVEYSSLYIWSKTAGVLWKPAWVYFFIPFLCLFFKKSLSRGTRNLVIKLFISFAGESCV